MEVQTSRFSERALAHAIYDGLTIGARDVHAFAGEVTFRINLECRGRRASELSQQCDIIAALLSRNCLRCWRIL